MSWFVAWKSHNKKRALKAVEKITDQETLATIAKYPDPTEIHTMNEPMHNHLEVCVAALQKITDANTLEDIANNAGYIRIRELARERMVYKNVEKIDKLETQSP